MDRGRGAGVRVGDAQRERKREGERERVVSKMDWKQQIWRTDGRVETEVMDKERRRGACETEDGKRHGVEKSG